MNAPIIYFEIQADDVKKTVDFYTNIFGWECTLDSSLPIEYYRVKSGNINGGILKRPAPVTSQGTNSYVCSMEVDNFDTFAEKILAAGGQVAMDKFAVPGAAHFAALLPI